MPTWGNLLKLTENACAKLEVLAEPYVGYNGELFGSVLNIHGYPEIYFDIDDNEWYDNCGDLICWDNNGFKSLFQLLEAMNYEIQKRSTQVITPDEL